MCRWRSIRKHVLGTISVSAFASWGLLLALQPAFYPTEAESHGATPSQYGFVFGCSSLAAFLFGPIFGTYGERIGPKLLFNLGGLTQGLVGIVFGSLDYIENTAGLCGLCSDVHCAVQKNSVPAAAGAVETSHTVFLLNRVQCFQIVNDETLREKTTY